MKAKQFVNKNARRKREFEIGDEMENSQQVEL